MKLGLSVNPSQCRGRNEKRKTYESNFGSRYQSTVLHIGTALCRDRRGVRSLYGGETKDASKSRRDPANGRIAVGMTG